MPLSALHAARAAPPCQCEQLGDWKLEHSACNLRRVGAGEGELESGRAVPVLDQVLSSAPPLFQQLKLKMPSQYWGKKI